MRFHRAALIGGLLLSVFTLAGCSGPPEQPAGFPSNALTEKYPTTHDLALARAACLEDKGWTVEVADDGTSETIVPPGQDDIFARDSQKCLEGLGVVDRQPTSDELEWAYGYFVESVRCLRGAGYDVGDAPSLQTFLEDYGTSRSWLPWSAVAAADLDDAMAACPPPPPIY